MICKKIGVEPDCTFLNDVQSYFHGAESNEIREEFEAVHQTYKNVSDRIDKAIYLANKEKVAEQEK